MRSNPSCPEGRQHINLSQYAYDIVRNDSLNFLGTLNISGFINTIIENSKLDTFEDLSLMEEERILDELTEYSRSGSTVRPTESELKIIKKIASAHRYHILNSSNRYPKNVTLKIKLNKKLHNELYPLTSEWYGKEYGISQGEYIKSIIEEYARKTYYERECIFFKDRLDELYRYISEPNDEKRILSISMKNGKSTFCKLYRLSEEYETHYHYLIGLFKDEGESEYMIASIRLSRIIDMKPRGRSLGSGKITQNEKKRIEDRIKESSIPYLKATPTEYVIRLTPMGMIMYDYNYSRRPIYDSLNENDDGTYTMKLKATERQIRNYFFAFGKEAVILSPEETRIWMKEKYTLAKDEYIL